MRTLHWLASGSQLSSTIKLLAVVGGVQLALVTSGLTHWYWSFLAITGLVFVLVVVEFVIESAWYLLLSPERRRFRLRVFQTDYGRQCRWCVECLGRPLVVLSDVRFEEMFWHSYVVEPLVETAAERERIVSDPAWWLQPNLEYRNLEFNLKAPWVIVSTRELVDSGRLLARGLNLYIGEPVFWERLWLRSRSRVK